MSNKLNKLTEILIPISDNLDFPLFIYDHSAEKMFSIGGGQIKEISVDENVRPYLSDENTYCSYFSHGKELIVMYFIRTSSLDGKYTILLQDSKQPSKLNSLINTMLNRLESEGVEVAPPPPSPVSTGDNAEMQELRSKIESGNEMLEVLKGEKQELLKRIEELETPNNDSLPKKNQADLQEQLNNALAELKEKTAQLSELNDENSSNAVKVQNLLAEKENIEKQLEELKSNPDKGENSALQNVDIISSVAILNEKDTEIDRLNTRILKLESELLSLKSDKPADEKKPGKDFSHERSLLVDSLNKQLINLEAENASLNKDIISLRKFKELYESLAAGGQTAGIGTESDLIAELKKENESLLQSLEALKQNTNTEALSDDELLAENEKLHKEISMLETANEEEVKDLKNKLNICKEQLIDLRSINEKLMQERDALESAINNGEGDENSGAGAQENTTEEIKRLNEEINKLNEDKAELQLKIDEISLELESGRNVNTDELSDRLVKTEKELDQLYGEYERLEEENKSISAKLSDQNSNQSKSSIPADEKEELLQDIANKQHEIDMLKEELAKTQKEISNFAHSVDNNMLEGMSKEQLEINRLNQRIADITKEKEDLLLQLQEAREGEKAENIVDESPLEEEIKRLTLELEQYKASPVEQESFEDEFRQAEEELEKLAHEYELLKVENEKLHADIALLKSKEVSLSRDFGKAIKTLQDRNVQLGKDNAVLKEELSSAEVRLSEINSKYISLAAENDKIKTSLNIFKSNELSSMYELENKLKAAQSDNEKLNIENTYLKELKTQLEAATTFNNANSKEFQTKFEDIQKQYEKVLQQYEETKTYCEDIENENNWLKEEVASSATFGDEIESLKEILKFKENEVTALDENILQLQQNLKEQQQKIGELEVLLADKERELNVAVVQADKKLSEQMEQFKNSNGAKLKEVVEGLTVPIVLVNKDKKTELVNKALINFSGADENFNNESPADCYSLVHHQPKECRWCLADKVAVTKEPAQIAINNEDGRQLLLVFTPVFDDDGKLVNIVETITDKTEVYELANTLSSLKGKMSEGSEELLKENEEKYAAMKSNYDELSTKYETLLEKNTKMLKVMERITSEDKAKELINVRSELMEAKDKLNKSTSTISSYRKQLDEQLEKYSTLNSRIFVQMENLLTAINGKSQLKSEETATILNFLVREFEVLKKYSDGGILARNASESALKENKPDGFSKKSVEAQRLEAMVNKNK